MHATCIYIHSYNIKTHDSELQGQEEADKGVSYLKVALL